MVQRVGGHDRMRIHSIGSLRKVALLSHLEKGVGVEDKDVSGLPGSSGGRTSATVLSTQKQPQCEGYNGRVFRKQWQLR